METKYQDSGKGYGRQHQVEGRPEQVLAQLESGEEDKGGGGREQRNGQHAQERVAQEGGESRGEQNRQDDARQQQGAESDERAQDSMEAVAEANRHGRRGAGGNHAPEG